MSCTQQKLYRENNYGMSKHITHLYFPIEIVQTMCAVKEIKNIHTYDT